MSRLKHRFAPLAAALAGLGLIVAPAAQGDIVVTLTQTNWHVSGALGNKKLGQDITLPTSSRYNGTVQISDDNTGTLFGDTTIPPFTASLTIPQSPSQNFPAQIGVMIAGTASPNTTGTLQINPDGTVTFDATTSSDMRITSLQLGPVTAQVGSNCHTSSPVLLPLHTTAPSVFDPLTNGLRFSGTYNLPPLTGCGAFTSLLNNRMAGPDNPFAVTISPR
jgi:hypothetical protein